MQASNFSLEDYLLRINYAGGRDPNLETLTALMQAQVRSIAFENQDVQAGKIVSLVPEDIVNKIIYSKRGGYCYELNGIFANAIHLLGFKYKFVGARPMFYPSRRPKTHVVLWVDINGQQYLCDLGFGNFGIREPLNIAHVNVPIWQDMDEFRLTLQDAPSDFFPTTEWVLQARVGGQWQNQFCFDGFPLEWIDLTLPNYFNSTHPDTIFVQKLVALIQTDTGRKSLAGNMLKVFQNGALTETLVQPHDLPKILRTEFGLPWCLESQHINL